MEENKKVTEEILQDEISEKETVEEVQEEMVEKTLAEKIELAEKHHAKSNTKSKMNLPNKLSMLRIVLVPIMVLLFYIQTPLSVTASLVVFIIASITDFLDGHIARKHNLVTDFGKFIDPIADKLLVVTALILISSSAIVILPYVAEISLIIVVAREFAISGLRLVAANNGTVIAADKLGKLKTVTQIVAIIALLFAYSMYVTSTSMYEAFYNQYMTYGTSTISTSSITICYNTAYYGAWVGTVVYIISTIICVISGISYLVKNKEAFTQSK